MYEKMVEILNEYMKSTGVEFYFVYELNDSYTIQIYYRIPFHQTVERKEFRGKTDIMFAKLFIEEVKNKQNRIPLLTYKNKMLYYLNR